MGGKTKVPVTQQPREVSGWTITGNQRSFAANYMEGKLAGETLRDRNIISTYHPQQTHSRSSLSWVPFSSFSLIVLRMRVDPGCFGKAGRK